MTILVCGAGGQVGRELVDRAGCRALVGTTKFDLDITDSVQTRHVIESIRPSIVINVAAYTAVDKAETDAAIAFAINRDGPRILAETCNDAGVPLFHLSTDYIFDGSSPHPYAENAEACPLGIYGQSKWAGEQAVRHILDAHLILRVSWVFGAYGNNFVRTILRLARERPELRIVADQQGAPTHAGAIAEVLLNLADRVVAGESLPWGTYHYSGEPQTTWHEFAKSICNEALSCGLLKQVPLLTPITTAEFPTPARRPANSLLSNEATRKKLGLNRRQWIDGLREVFQIWKPTT